ncbi:cytochrome P450 [Mycena pura]|uniref:Cytochrome P450 n=1 Tax=Mycena pura TaxID=153505 RepID=A0AAD6YS40_9AGAR|nr:cytochrome P450 [Mycena pura]
MSSNISTLLGTIGAYALYTVVKALYAHLSSPLRKLPGPPSAHWFYGNTTELIEDQFSGLIERWVQQYGPTFRIHQLLGTYKLLTTDTKAIHHILNNTHIYQKSETMRDHLSRIVGPGILVVENEDHRRQNPAFGVPQVRALTDIFVQKSIELRDIWIKQAARGGGLARVEALSALNKASLDIIGLAGFNYDIRALEADEDTPPDELIEAFNRLCTLQTGMSISRFMRQQFPILRHIPTTADRIAKESQAEMRKIGQSILEERKRQVGEGATFETGRGRDLLSLLVRANTAKDVPASQRLSDEDVVAQVPTFLVAGHETSSTAITWALFALTQNKTAQTELRQELLTVSTDAPTLDELDHLPYLDCVVRETLRLHAPVTDMNRIALKDDVVPLEKPYTDSKGVVCETVHVKKGQLIFIPVTALNHDTTIWGDDAMEFKPERWAQERPISNSIPGIYNHMLTFSGGPRNCMGFRFAVAEIKAFLFTLFRAFEFDLGAPRADIGQRDTGVVIRPMLLSEPEGGSQLPLLMKPVAAQ